MLININIRLFIIRSFILIYLHKNTVCDATKVTDFKVCVLKVIRIVK